ncbi:hypothetical protein ALC53_00184, partial [Atta colombica]
LAVDGYSNACFVLEEVWTDDSARPKFAPNSDFLGMHLKLVYLAWIGIIPNSTILLVHISIHPKMGLIAKDDLFELLAKFGLQYVAWEQRCDAFIESLEEQSRVKRPRLSIGIKQLLIVRITRLESFKGSVHDRFVQVDITVRDSDDTLDISSQFLEDANEIVLERVRDIMQRHNCIKINIVFNDQFITSDLHEWYAWRVVEPILTSLEEFQERDSGWTLSRNLNLTFNVNKYNTLHAENLCKITFYKFFASSLEKLVVSRLKIIWSEFLNLSAEDFDLLMRKDIFPYEYIENLVAIEMISIHPKMDLIAIDNLFGEIWVNFQLLQNQSANIQRYLPGRLP